MGERFHPRRKKTPSFSSSLLDAILVSIDEPLHDITKKGKSYKFDAEDDDHDKWMHHDIKGTTTTTTTTTRRSHSKHFDSDSGSSAESSLFSSIETEPPAAVSRSAGSNKKREEGGRLFMKTRLKALKIYKDLKKVRQPISPGGKFTSFLNSFLFNTKNSSISGDKSRPVKDSGIKSQTLSPCLDKVQAPVSSAATNKSKRSVTFCPAVSVITEESHQKKKNIYDLKQSSRMSSAECVPKSIERFRDYGVKHSYEYDHLFRGFTEQECSNYEDDDGESCTSSDLFELDNIGILEMVSSDDELPVYGTTKLSRTQGFATMVVV